MIEWDITADEWDAFQYLTDDEKMFYFHEVLCGFDPEESGFIDYDEIPDENEGELLLASSSGYFTSFKDFISFTMNDDEPLNIHVIDKLLILNSDDLVLIETACTGMIQTGFILIRETEDVVKKCQVKKYCWVYTNLGLGNKIVLN